MHSIQRMLKLSGIAMMMCVWIGSYQAVAAGLDGSTPILCAFTTAAECDSRNGCERTTVEDVDLPQFFKIDLSKNTITGMGAAGAAQKETRIMGTQRMDETIILQGVELRGWTIVISEKTGKMVLTASGDDEAFVLFGVCLPF